MQQKEQNEFEQRFAERQRIFLSALDGLLGKTSCWQLYVDDQQFTPAGELVIEAVKDGPPSSDLDELHQYCKFITGEGFHLEIVADPQRNLHVVAWEDYEPDWPSDLDAVVSLQWHTVKGAL